MRTTAAPAILDDLQCLSVELVVYRKGSLTVQLNLQEGLMTWSESRQWCNNFVRSLSHEQIGKIRRALGESRLPDVLARYAADCSLMAADRSPTAAGCSSAAAGPSGRTVQVLLQFSDRLVHLDGDNLDPDIWTCLLAQIEKNGRAAFRL
jgi:hypothetical protein